MSDKDGGRPRDPRDEIVDGLAYSFPEAAAYIGVEPSRIYQLRDSGEITVVSYEEADASGALPVGGSSARNFIMGSEIKRFRAMPRRMGSDKPASMRRMG